jgi:hypothetical protein
MILHVTIDSCLASYEITPEMDGIYKAKLLSKISNFLQFEFPAQIILIKTESAWSSDHYPKELGLTLGNKIDQYEADL